jgi:hypothetical protein
MTLRCRSHLVYDDRLCPCSNPDLRLPSLAAKRLALRFLNNRAVMRSNLFSPLFQATRSALQRAMERIEGDRLRTRSWIRPDLQQNRPVNATPWRLHNKWEIVVRHLPFLLRLTEDLCLPAKDHHLYLLCQETCKLPARDFCKIEHLPISRTDTRLTLSVPVSNRLCFRLG